MLVGTHSHQTSTTPQEKLSFIIYKIQPIIYVVFLASSQSIPYCLNNKSSKLARSISYTNRSVHLWILQTELCAALSHIYYRAISGLPTLSISKGQHYFSYTLNLFCFYDYIFLRTSSIFAITYCNATYDTHTIVFQAPPTSVFPNAEVWKKWYTLYKIWGRAVLLEASLLQINAQS